MLFLFTLDIQTDTTTNTIISMQISIPLPNTTTKYPYSPYPDYKYSIIMNYYTINYYYNYNKVVEEYYIVVGLRVHSYSRKVVFYLAEAAAVVLQRCRVSTAVATCWRRLRSLAWTLRQ